jgi:hypothetical protein
MIQINTNEVFELQPDGSTILVSVEEVEVNVKTTEELLKEKQDELLKVYGELQAIQAQIDGGSN